MGVILLVRHGQASFGAEDYDRLSQLGHAQARALGQTLAERGCQPAAVISGSLRRQRDTAQAVMAGAGWRGSVVVDPRWDEFDHEGMVATYASCGMADPRRFQEHLDRAMVAWAGDSQAEQESFEHFAARTMTALESIAGTLGRGQVAVVVSSAGVISWLTAVSLAGSVDQWVRLNRVCVNTGVTKLVVGTSGTSLVTFNDHSHLGPDMTTYR